MYVVKKKKKKQIGKAHTQNLRNYKNPHSKGMDQEKVSVHIEVDVE